MGQMTALAAAPPAPAEAVEQLIEKDLVGVPDKEVLMLTVEYLPGGASLPHRHDAQVFVYVLQGELRMQVAGGPAVTLRPGQTFYENPTDVHVVSANASKTAPAKILVFIVKDKRAAVIARRRGEGHAVRRRRRLLRSCSARAAAGRAASGVGGGQRSTARAGGRPRLLGTAAPRAKLKTIDGGVIDLGVSVRQKGRVLEILGDLVRALPAANAAFRTCL